MLLPLLVVLAATPQADKPLEETKTNIVVLKGVPTSQLIPIMTVMANSLGVACTYCHESNGTSTRSRRKRLPAG